MTPFRFLRRSLRRRIITLVGLGMLSLSAIFAVSTLRGSEELSERALHERQRLAQALADHLDYILRSNLILLQDVALAARGGLSEVDIKIKPALRDAYLRSIFTEGVFLVDGTGRLVWFEPQQFVRPEEDFFALPVVRRALQEGKPEVSGLVVQGKRRIYAAVPIRDWRGELTGAIGGELDPESPRFRALLNPARTGETTYLDLVDGNGIVLASTREQRAFTESDHGRFLANLIQKKRPVVGACHSCHQENGVREREVMAFAPLTFAPWGVNIRQSESEALAGSLTMERNLFWVGSLTILVALLFAWGVARSVTRPLGLLANAAQRIATGDLDQPIPPLGEDEIGHLARSFDRMRTALKASLDTIAEGTRDLENRVQERTHELQALYKELQKKEEARRVLLKKVIAAQEDERKRIARELHDETSQASTALLLAIEATGKNVPTETRERLQRMKAMADRVLDSIHHLIYDLRPSMLDDLGLASALRSSAESRLEPMGIDLSFEVLGSERRLKPEIETTVFRIGQEAIANIVRHAEAESVQIILDFGDDAVRLQVNDDGKGFDAEEVGGSIDRGRGLGVLGMQERANLLDGTVAVQSAPGQGTRITAAIPLQGPA